jgi:hypothetical protein
MNKVDLITKYKHQLILMNPVLKWTNIGKLFCGEKKDISDQQVKFFSQKVFSKLHHFATGVTKQLSFHFYYLININFFVLTNSPASSL